METAWEPSELDDTIVARYATVPLSPGIHRETEGLQDISIRPETLRRGGGDSLDISCPPSPPLPSLREEPGRQEEETVPRSNSSCESIISETDHPDGLDLERYQAVQPCTVGLPHSCEDYWSTRTDEEFRQLLKWVKRVFQGEDLRPDVKISVENRDGSFHMGFACSLLREMRLWVPLTP